MRILITGSRDWDDYETIGHVLNEQYWEWFESNDLDGITLVSGQCPTGADRLCEKWFEEKGMHVEYHPADWNKYGKRAGFIRNQEMVDSGADVCLAFIKNESKGATMTARIAEAAGIPTRRYVA